MKNVPFEKVKAQRVSYFRPLQISILWSYETLFKRAGTANLSLVGKLLDDYEATDVIDLDHEDDIKQVASAMYAGEM